MDPLTLVLLIIGLILLIAGAELFVRGAAELAALIGVSSLVIGLTVVAYGTSTPELAVCLRSALTAAAAPGEAEMSGAANLVAGNVVGSNICNILLILGVSSLVCPLAVSGQLIRWDVPLMIGASVLMLLLGWNGRIERVEGLLLFLGSVVYTVHSLRKSRKETREVFVGHDTPKPPRKPSVILLQFVFIVVGVTMLVIGSGFVVDGAVQLATALGISELVIGLTIVAVGTSLPEIATSVVAGIRGQRDIAVGNAVGSNLFNILLVIGLVAAVSPTGVKIPDEALRFDIPVMIAVAVACLPVFFTNSTISRWEGAFFVLYYAGYTTFLVYKTRQHEPMSSMDMMGIVFVLPLILTTLLVIAVHTLRIARGRAGTPRGPKS